MNTFSHRELNLGSIQIIRDTLRGSTKCHIELFGFFKYFFNGFLSENPFLVKLGFLLNLSLTLNKSLLS